MNPKVQLMLQQAIQAFKGGNFSGAGLIVQEVLQDDINSADMLLELGVVYAKANRLMEASIIFCHLQIYKNNDERIPYNLGLIHSLQGNHQLALAAYDSALNIQPDDAWVLTNKGSTYNDIKNYVLALGPLDKAIKLRPEIPEAWSNKGIALNGLNLYQESINAYNKAIELHPSYHEAWSNKSVPLNRLKRFLEALDACDKALNLKPDYAEAWSNKGVTLNELKRYDDALAHYDKALNLKPDYAEAWSNKGGILNALKRYEDAINHYVKALSIEPDINWLYGDLLHVKMQVCSWIDLADSMESLSKKVMANEKVSGPFQLLALNDDAQLHKKASEIFIQSNHPSSSVLGEIPRPPRDEKIRIGYFSADFKNHPVAYLIAELFEIHDKSKFELYGFSLVKACDAMRGRLQKAFDHFIDIDGISDVEVAKLARDKFIDIAVDLSGFTNYSRTGIFSHRAAPIQVNYLGYPGTMGADYIDYIIADKILIPPDSQSHYSEKVIYLPNSYQVNDRKRIISDRLFTKEELGLPDTGFVFCCFNNNYKILPPTFDSWMRILKMVDGSILWLFQEDNPQAVDNLKQEAEKHGVAHQRIVFAGRVPLSEHLARYRYANLFLDTLPYNAHTTASDALWTGLPVLTQRGQSFASRVAASLLSAIGLPELITSSQEEYEELAIELALNPTKLADIKLRLVNNCLTAPLFDTLLFTKNIEAAYMKMYDRYQNDLKPEHIFIP
jgi:predicted O-linked N-acetylglucosamine transferase (SPINDLY family)